MFEKVIESDTTLAAFAALEALEHPVNCVCAGCSARETFRDDISRQTDPVDGSTAGAAVVGTLQEMADFLRIDYWPNDTGQRHNLGTTGLDANDGVLHYNVTGFGTLPYGGGSDADGVSAARAELIRDAFDIYEAVLGIDFVETTSQDDSLVDIFFSDNKSGAYAGATRYSDGTIYYSYVNIDDGWSGGTSTYDDYTLQTIIHEIGHALGLGHQGDYNGSANYVNDADFVMDSWQASIMSYFPQTENTAVTASYEFLQTPMAVDWIALDDIYGQWGFGVDNAFVGDTVYGFGTNISAQTSRIWNAYADWGFRTASTIIDAGGIDTLDLGGYTANQKIDLTIQTADQTAQDSSDVGGRTGNLTLAVGTVIENAVGGAGNDRLLGNVADNDLRGGLGDDTLTGFAGDDQLHGGGGNDVAVFSFDYAAYAFAALQTALEVIGEGVDLVFDTIETLQFSDASYSYDDIYSLYGNGAPRAFDDAATVAEDAPATLDVLANDSDPENDAIAVTRIDGAEIAVGQTVALASGAAVTLNADGTLAYDQNGIFDALASFETGSDAFTYTIADAGGRTDTATVTLEILGETDPGPRATIGQSGTVTVSQSGPDQWHAVSFDEAIANAVVVLGPASFNDADPLTTRVRNVTETGFEFQIDEWDYLDGIHAAETLGWLAVSEGTHTLGTGQKIVAGRHDAGQYFSQVSFGETLADAVVLAEVATTNAPGAVAPRLRSVDGAGFEVELQSQEADVIATTETVGWIAVESGAGPGIDAFRSGDNVDHTGQSLAFTTAFGGAPVLLADMQTRDGVDPTTTRLTALDAAGVTLFTEEERSSDAETRHVTEDIGVVALAGGVIHVGGNTAPIAVDDALSVTEGASALLDPLANDSDPEGDPLGITAIDGTAIAVGETVTLASGASVSLTAEGRLAYDQNGVFETLLAGETAADGFAYEISDGQGGSAAAQVDLTIEGVGLEPSGPIGQAGSVTVTQVGPDQWHSVSFDASIANAVVVLGPVSDNDADPLTTRVRNVTETGFEFQIDEWSYLDGVHGAETLGWLAISEGTHILPDGQTIVAGQQSVGTGFTDVSFGRTLADAVVLTEVSTLNEADPVTTRVQNVGPTGFSVQLEEEEALGPHVDETVSWIAIESGTGSGRDVFRSAGTVTHQSDSFVFGTGFAAPPVLLADMQTNNGVDTSTVRLDALDAVSVSLFIEEEESADSETFHTKAESVGIVAWQEGLIHLDPAQMDAEVALGVGPIPSLDFL